MPETTAGVPAPRVLVLYHPEIPEPTFSTPELSVPALATPEPAPANTSCPWFHQPDVPAPTLANPDPPPPPVLKNPDDGAVVVLPNPGTAGTSMIGIGISPMRMVPSKVAGTVSRVNPSGNSVNASSPTDSPVTPGGGPRKGQPTWKKVNLSLATSIPTVTGFAREW